MKKVYPILINLGIILSLCCPQSSYSQILPPDFLCLSGDTLKWDLPINTCGPFNAYEVYVSQDVNGPYTLLGTVTDENQTSFFHSGAGGIVWYYYLLSDYDCPGLMQISSDTLDNRPPEVAIIEAVTVENSLVRINWRASSSIETIAYIIYRESNIGIVPIDTVFGALTYLDLNADPDNQTETYFVNALDFCGNTSIFDVRHNTLSIDNSVDACSQSIELTWGLYNNWRNPIDRHEIYVSENGGPFNLATTVTGTATTGMISNLSDGQNYCFFVKAIEANTGAFSDSPIDCETIQIVEPIMDLYIKSVDVLPNNQINVTWGWNDNAALATIDIFRLLPNDDVNSVISSPNIPVPLGDMGQFLDDSANPEVGNVSYQISTTDLCDTLTIAPFAESIFLSGQSNNDNINVLTWTPLSIQNAFSVNYSLFRIVDNNETLLTMLPGSQTEYFDAINISNPAEAIACYYIVANYTLASPTGSLEQLNMRSNIRCIQQEARIFVPNAFAPRGINREFKPLISFGDSAAYTMQIYDRYGKEIFTSIDPEVGWRGRLEGEDAPQGTYVYRIELKQTDGKIIKKNGVLVLIR